MNRRHLLVLLGAAACLPKNQPAPLIVQPEAPPPTGPIRLGWRWIPGTALTYRTHVTRSRHGLVVEQAEEWRYVAVELDPNGVVYLDATLVGRGLRATRNGVPVDDPRLTVEAPPRMAGVSLRMNGHLVACTEHDPAVSLPHRLLGLDLPAEPSAARRVWSDDTIAVPFVRMFPSRHTLEPVGSTMLASVSPLREGWLARLEHTATVRGAEGAPTLNVTGATEWRTHPGLLHERRLRCTLQPDVGPDGLEVGTLDVSVKLIAEEQPRRG